MPRGQKQKELNQKIVYVDTCPLIKEIYAPGDPEQYFAQFKEGLFEAFEQLEAKGLMGLPCRNKPAI